MSLRQQVLRGGVMLAFRQGVGTIVGVVGALLLTRAIGPRSYGLYAAALGVFSYLQSLSTWGVDVYLVRQANAARQDVFDEAFTLLMLLATACISVVLSLLPFADHWMVMSGFADVLRPMVLALPIILLGAVALARLEQRLDYQRIAAIELGVQILYYAVAIPLAFRGWGAFAPLCGWMAQRITEAASYVLVARYRPRFRWSVAELRRMVEYGLSFSASIWVWQLRNLVNPIIVGRFAGAEAVGIVALTIRLIEYLSFVKSVTWRISIAALGRIQDDRARLLRALSEGMRLQLLALGPLLVGFAVTAPYVMPLVFGEKWLPTLQIFPYIALSYLANAMFNMHSSVLYVLRRNWDVTVFHVTHILLFAGTALVFVPRFGLIGYGVAEGAALAAYVIAHRYVVERIGAPEYRAAFAWGAAFAIGLFVHSLGPAALIGCVIMLALPNTWLEFSAIRQQVFGTVRGVA